MPATDRPDPVALLRAQEESRVPELLPLRHERMAASPFAFYRGAAVVMAADLSTTHQSGLEVQLCGDAHLANFGMFAAPDRNLVLDLNDFDETLPGPFEWDVARLAASFEIAGRSRDLKRGVRAGMVDAATRSYVDSIRGYAAMTHLEVWYDRLTPDVIRRDYGNDIGGRLMERFSHTIAKAQRKDRMRAFEKLVTVEGGQPRFRSDPPVLVPVDSLLPEIDRDQLVAEVISAIDMYRRTMARDRQLLLSRYHFVDLARKVVGVGSVGTRCWVALLMGRTIEDPLFLQVKEAGPSVLEAYLGASEYDQHGERVVEGQRLIQSAPDVFLGWERRSRFLDEGVSDYYFRQLWDWKGSAELETMPPTALTLYGRICGRVLARAHARTGNAAAIAAYLGKGSTFVASLTEFSQTYADLNEADHRAFTEWLASQPAGVGTPAAD